MFSIYHFDHERQLTLYHASRPLHVGERMNSPTLYGRVQSFNCDSFYMGDLDGTMLHYVAVRKAMVSVHRPVHSKITLTTRLPGKVTAVHPGEWLSRAIKR